MTKKTKSAFLVYAIILAVYLVLFFAIPFTKGVAAWISFAFTIVAIVGGAGITYYAFPKGDDLKSKLYGFPVFSIGFIYSAVQFVFGLIICIVGSFVDVTAWIAVLVSVLIMALSAVGIIATDNIRDIITEQEQQTVVATKTMITFKLDMQYIVDVCKDVALKKQLEKLSEKFRYSDPVSCDELTEIEDRLKSEVKELEALVNADIAAAIVKTQSIEILLADRNRRCKEYK